MGMFDYLRCKYPLLVAGDNDLEWQTKDIDCGMNRAEIREDGTIWTKEWGEENEWCQRRFTGEVVFYDYTKDRKWVEYSAYFVKGQLKELHLLKDERQAA